MTVDPRGTVTFAGLKVKFWMVTVTTTGAAVVCTTVVAGTVVAGTIVAVIATVVITVVGGGVPGVAGVVVGAWPSGELMHPAAMTAKRRMKPRIAVPVLARFDLMELPHHLINDNLKKPMAPCQHQSTHYRFLTGNIGIAESF